MPLHHSINVADFRLVEIVYLEQGLKIASENGKRRAQFMGNIRDEIPANFVGLFQARNILKQGNYSTCRLTVVYNRNGGELKIFSFIRCAHFHRPRLRGLERIADRLEHINIAHDIEERCSGRDRAVAVKILKRRITKSNMASGIDHEQTIG